ncbi:MAG: glutathione S-transferase [Rubrivivax sp.]|nr:glutathione S-transferase [Rubrivivax sp.]
MTALTLYDCATAPSPRRARILLAEKGIAHATVPVDLRSGEQLGEAFRRINPLCTVPVLLTDDGLSLSDNASIIAWVEARFPDPPLCGRTPAEKALVAHWHWRAEFEGLMAVAEALRNGSPAMARRALPGPVNYEQIPALAERGRERLLHFLAALDQRLAQVPFLAGEDFSLADITAVVAVDFARAIKIKPGDEHPHLLRWRAVLAQRPSLQG